MKQPTNGTPTPATRQQTEEPHSSKCALSKSPACFPARWQAAALFQSGFGQPSQSSGLVSALSTHRRSERRRGCIHRRICQEYQVVLKPEQLLAFKLPLATIMSAIQRSNNDVGGSVIELSENEYMVRSRGISMDSKTSLTCPLPWVKTARRSCSRMSPRCKSPGEERRGVGEWNGQGEAVRRCSHCPLWS